MKRNRSRSIQRQSSGLWRCTSRDMHHVEVSFLMLHVEGIVCANARGFHRSFQEFVTCWTICNSSGIFSTQIDPCIRVTQLWREFLLVCHCCLTMLKKKTCFCVQILVVVSTFPLDTHLATTIPFHHPDMREDLQIRLSISVTALYQSHVLSKSVGL